MDRFFGFDKPVLNEEGLSLLFTLYDDVSLEMTEALLREEKIPYLKKDRSGGGAMRIILGSNPHGTDLFVPTERLEEALALFEAECEDAAEEGELK